MSMVRSPTTRRRRPHGRLLSRARVLSLAVALLLTSPALAEEPAAAPELLPLSLATEATEAPAEARGVLEPRDEAVLSSEINARILELPFDEGDRFAAGMVLVRFDCDLYEARLAAAAAAREAARLQVESDRKLAELNSIGVLELAQSEARLREAEAEVRLNRLWTARCRIAAPYDGRVVGRRANAFESVEPGDELLEVVAEGEVEIKLIVPSVWLAWLKPGVPFLFSLDETGSHHPAVVTKIGARIDAVSQTIAVIGGFTDAPATPLPGMSGTARFRDAGG